jgi:S-DNA-T family DNA segregation ATPase FtsK/SpoIIIE
VGLTCVLTADRAVPGSRLAAVAAERLVLPLSDRADYAVAGVAPAAVPSHRPPGRALVGDAAFECQLARFTGALPVDRWNTGRAGAEGPLHIAELTPDPVLPADDGRRGPAAGALEVLLGPGGDDGRPLRWDLDRQGGLLVVGPPGSGRTATLDALVEELTARGTAVLRVDARGPVRDDPADRCATWIDPRDTHGLSAWLTGLSDTGGVIVADDLGAAVDWPVVAQFSGSDRSHRQPVLIAAGSAAELTAHYQGPIAALRRARTGLLLCPGPAEADVLGVRLPRTPLPVRPGSGWLAAGGRLTRVQVARRRLGNPAAVVG